MRGLRADPVQYDGTLPVAVVIVDQRTIESLFQLDLFEGLEPPMREIVVRETRSARIGAGETLFMQGTPARYFYYVLDGWVSVFREQRNGARVVLHVFGKHESFGEVAALGMDTYPASAEAATEAQVLCISAATYEKLIVHDPSFAMTVIGKLAQRMRALISEFEHSQQDSGTHRLAAFLVDLVRHEGGLRSTLRLPFSKQLLAARLHMQPESLSRAFAELRSLGVESKRDGSLSIANLESLEQLLAG